MSSSSDFIQTLKQRVPVSAVVGRIVKLKKKGPEWIGLCPFHQEKTPSLTVNDSKGFYHCFGCGTHGDALGFLTDYDGLPFLAAVERLAQMAGLSVPPSFYKKEDSSRTKQQKNLWGILGAAIAHYQKQLRMPHPQQPLHYLQNRGLGRDSLNAFQIGFAPAPGTLRAALKEDNLSELLLVESGLFIQRDDDTLYERFQGRIIFPILDEKSRPIGLGGRIIGDGQPKYLNSPQTSLFHKGANLFALEKALNSIYRKKRALVAEGYMDVITLHAFDFTEAVGSLGTALTELQIQILWRKCPHIILCFDGDSAGQKAAFRAACRALEQADPYHSLQILTLPAQDDPDSFLRRYGGTALEEEIKKAPPLSSFLFNTLWHQAPPQDAETFSRLEADLQSLARTATHPSIRKNLLQFFKERLWESRRSRKHTAMPSFSKFWRSRGGQKDYQDFAPQGILTTETSVRRKKDRQLDLEKTILALLVFYGPQLLEFLEPIGQISFHHSELDKLRQRLVFALEKTAETPATLTALVEQEGLSIEALSRRSDGLILTFGALNLQDAQTILRQSLEALHS